MKIVLLPVLLFVFSSAPAQMVAGDYRWWNELHDWDTGDPNWRSYLIISPGYLGPNALPVPDVKKGYLQAKTEFEITASNHFFNGDPTRDISGRIYIPFAKNRVAIEMYGVALEQYAYSEEIRNERFSRDENGKGIMAGDFYFSTLIQICRDKAFPNTLFRFASKTTTGEPDAARYTDTPGFFLDLSFSKDLFVSGNRTLRPFGLFGFYNWQTYDELNPQNDAYLYALGADFEKNDWLWSASWSGYTGYKNNGDRPMQLNFDVRKDFEKTSLRFQYLHGLRDWKYKTVKFSFIWKFGPVH